jgi:hypothetical protein
MKDIVKIENRVELIGFLRALGTECRFITVDTETPVKNMPKTGNPYWGTIKIARRNGIVNMDYVTAVEKRFAEQHGLDKKDVTYTPGSVWYKHCQTEGGKALCLCEGNTVKTKGKYYLQFFPLRDIGETVYVHPTLGTLSKDQVKDMEGRMYDRTKVPFKPNVITLEIDSIRSVTFRKIKLINETVSRLTGRLSRFKGAVVSTAKPKSKDKVRTENEGPDDAHIHDVDETGRW